ncbi:hypothetical protein EPO15_06070 [bacterium]|nr:MAG: hypothetical protein EPO15_06070 [bacterium]
MTAPDSARGPSLSTLNAARRRAAGFASGGRYRLSTAWNTGRPFVAEMDTSMAAEDTVTPAEAGTESNAARKAEVMAGL